MSCVHYVKIVNLLLSPKNVIDAIQSEGILNHIGLRWIMAIGKLGYEPDMS